MDATDSIMMLAMMARVDAPSPWVPGLERALRAFSNFRLAVLEEGWDEWIDLTDGFDWVTLKESGDDR